VLSTEEGLRRRVKTLEVVRYCRLSRSLPCELIGHGRLHHNTFRAVSVSIKSPSGAVWAGKVRQDPGVSSAFGH
jgi:hypothetical protein